MLFVENFIHWSVYFSISTSPPIFVLRIPWIQWSLLMGEGPPLQHGPLTRDHTPKENPPLAVFNCQNLLSYRQGLQCPTTSVLESWVVCSSAGHQLHWVWEFNDHIMSTCHCSDPIPSDLWLLNSFHLFSFQYSLSLEVTWYGGSFCGWALHREFILNTRTSYECVLTTIQCMKILPQWPPRAVLIYELVTDVPEIMKGAYVRVKWPSHSQYSSEVWIQGWSLMQSR